MKILYFVLIPLIGGVKLRGTPPTTPLLEQSTVQVMKGITQPMGTFSDLDAAPLSMPVFERTVSTYSPYDRVEFTGANAQGIQDPIKSTSWAGDLPSFTKPTPPPYSTTKIDLGVDPVLDISKQMLSVGIPALDTLSIPNPVAQPEDYPNLTKLKNYIDEYNAFSA